MHAGQIGVGIVSDEHDIFMALVEAAGLSPFDLRDENKRDLVEKINVETNRAVALVNAPQVMGIDQDGAIHTGQVVGISFEGIQGEALSVRNEVLIRDEHGDPRVIVVGFLVET